MTFEHMAISRIADVELGKMLNSTPNKGDILMPYLRAAHIQPRGQVLDLGDEQQMYFSPREAASLNLKRGDMVIVEGGAGYGRSAVLERDYEGWGFQNSIIRVRPRGRRADARFLSYSLQMALLRGEVDLAVNTATIPHFTAEKVSRFALPMPSGEEQRLIADYLDRETAKIDTLIEKQQRMLLVLRKRATTMAGQLVWGIPRAESAEIAGLPEMPESWTVVRNKDLWRESKILSLRGDEEPLSVSHITGVTRRSEKKVTMIEAESYEGYRIVHPGDLVINTMWAWMGALGIAELDGIVSPAYGVYRATKADSIDLRYFNHLYRSAEYVRYMESWSRGLWSSRLRLYPEVFLSLPVPLPPLEEQREIAGHLDRETAKIDTLIAKAERFIELAQERRAALITAAVTGQIEIPTED